MPDCYYVIRIVDASEEEGVAAGKPFESVCADVKSCGEHAGGQYKKCDKKDGTADAEVHYPTRPAAEANLERIRDCLVRRGNDVVDFGIRG